jgi:isoquinoline 1-oxidoreductase beta subunit
MTATRREFLVGTGAAATGLVIGLYLPHSSSRAHADHFSPNAYLRISPDNKVTVVVARSEMGQGVHTALPMILAEELEADWSNIIVEQAGASTLYGDQTTGGSASVRTTWDPMRKAGAAAREMLITAAAARWSVARATCKAQKGAIVHSASGRKLSYGELAGDAARLPVPTDAPLKDSKDYSLVGTRLPRLETTAKVTGSLVYGIDFRVPGMKYACLARCPVFGGKVRDFEDRESRQVGGVAQVAKVHDSAVAVVADTVWAAMEGRRLLKVNWDEGPNRELNSAAIRAQLKQAGASGKAASLYVEGDTAKATGRKLEAVYELPFMAHAPLEPGNSVAHFRGSSCEIWSPTQVPQDVRDASAQALGLTPEQVKVNVLMIGGGFGRRLEHDYAVEAALVSKLINAPAKVMWTREDDMRNSTYRPASLHLMSAVLDGHGYPAAFTHRLVAPSINGQKGTTLENGVDPDLKDEAAFLYPIPNIKLEYVQAETAVPLGWMRSVYALQAAFASESFIDEMAHAAGQDPLAYRLHLLASDRDVQYFDTRWRTERLRGVLNLAAEKAGWGKSLPAGHYHGLACFGSFASYVAEAVEISMNGDTPRVHRVVAAADCGQVINPTILEQQIQGAVIYALTNALHAKIDIDKGRVVQGNFDDYAPVRMDEAPAVEAYYVKSTEAPSGIGEPPVPPLAPALCNAIFAATGRRIRALPILSS